MSMIYKKSLLIVLGVGLNFTACKPMHRVAEADGMSRFFRMPYKARWRQTSIHALIARDRRAEEPRVSLIPMFSCVPLVLNPGITGVDVSDEFSRSTRDIRDTKALMREEKQSHPKDIRSYAGRERSGKKNKKNNSSKTCMQRRVEDVLVSYIAHEVPGHIAEKLVIKVMSDAEKMAEKKVVSVKDLAKLIIAGMPDIRPFNQIVWNDLPADTIHDFITELNSRGDAMRGQEVILFVFDQIKEIFGGQKILLVSDDQDELDDELVSDMKELALSDDNFSDARTVGHPKSRGLCNRIHQKKHKTKRTEGTKRSKFLRHAYNDKKNKNTEHDWCVNVS